MALLFIALAVGSGSTTSPENEIGARDIAWASLSLLGFAALLVSLYISYRQADDRQQLIQLKATSLSFAVLIFSVVAVQMLHALNLINLDIALQCLVIGGLVLWTVLLKVVERRNNP